MTRRGIAPLLTCLVLLAACSTGPGAPTSAPSASPTTSAPPATAGGTVSIGVASSALGDHLVGPNGHALYVFSNDSANTSACSGGCAATWPPLSVGAGQTPAAGTGVTATVGTITREDGTLQVTANGMPLYYYAPDVSETDTTGQGVGGVWFLAAPDGSPLGDAAGGTTPASAPAATDGYGGYGG